MFQDFPWFDGPAVNSCAAVLAITPGGVNAVSIILWPGIKGRPYLSRRQCLRMTVKEKVMAHDGRRCHYCYRYYPGKMGFDHRTPLSRGGRNNRKNLAYVCHDCNIRKGQMTEEEFRQVIGGRI